MWWMVQWPLIAFTSKPCQFLLHCSCLWFTFTSRKLFYTKHKEFRLQAYKPIFVHRWCGWHQPVAQIKLVVLYSEVWESWWVAPVWLTHLTEVHIKIGMCVTLMRQPFYRSEVVHCLHGPFRPKHWHSTSARDKLHIVLRTRVMSLPFAHVCSKAWLAQLQPVLFLKTAHSSLKPITALHPGWG